MRYRACMGAVLAICAAVGLGWGGNQALAQTQTQTDWPTRPVRLVIPYPAGSGTDFIVRALAERLSRQLGQQFVVEHRGGAGGTLGTEAVVRSTPDGYTVLMTPQAPIVVLPNLRKLAYDPLKDLTAVARMGEVIAGFAVHPSLGVKNMAEFVALAKQKPGEITFVSAGVGTVNHLRGETLKLMAGIDLTHVPYRGNGEAVPDLLAGQVHCIFDTVVFPHAKAGKLTLLAILADQRYSEFPEVGTIKEQGFPEFDLPIWFGTFVPAGVPAPIVQKLHAAISTIHSDEDFKARQLSGGIYIYPQADSLEELKGRLVRQTAYFADVIKRANVTLD
ncbi:MAG: Bug family tripartite tricarboxylate transporter substrate binding protein [Acetobacteraceae bacterium]